MQFKSLLLQSFLSFILLHIGSIVGDVVVGANDVVGDNDVVGANVVGANVVVGANDVGVVTNVHSLFGFEQSYFFYYTNRFFFLSDYIFFYQVSPIFPYSSFVPLIWVL